MWFVRINPSSQRRLKDLSFIHFARWVIVTESQFPTFDKRLGSAVHKFNYLFFASNFNGRWDEYIDAFALVIPRGLWLFWGTSLGYPGAASVTKLKDYAWENSYQTAYYYNATPGSSLLDIQSALHLYDRLVELEKQVETLSDEVFAEAYDEFLYDVHRNLGATGVSGTPVRPDDQPFQ